MLDMNSNTKTNWRPDPRDHGAEVPTVTCTVDGCGGEVIMHPTPTDPHYRGPATGHCRKCGANFEERWRSR